MSYKEHRGRKDLVPPEVDGPLRERSPGSSVRKGELFTPRARKASGRIVFSFNKHAQNVLKTLLASGFQKRFIILTKRLQGKRATLTQDLDTSIISADFSSEAIRKIFRKYKQVHGSTNGVKYKTEFQNVHLEDLSSPCLCELMAFHTNVKERKNRKIPGQFDECKLQTSEGRSSLSITLSNSRVLDVDLNCSICLETFFDPVSLTCGHMFCYMCSCSAGSVTTFEGIKDADSKSKCPLCRKEGVFRGAVRMSQLSVLLRRKFPEYWEERRQKERQARLKEAKEYWEFQCRIFAGVD